VAVINEGANNYELQLNRKTGLNTLVD